MKLKNAAKLFDNLTFTNAYNTSEAFKGQFDLYDDSRRDGMAIERRILSVAPDVIMPARRTVTADGLTWLVGDSQRDYFKSEAIRHKYVVHLAQELVALKTVDDVLSAAAGTPSWVSSIWVKASKEIETSSDMINVFDIYFAEGESAAIDKLVQVGGRWCLIRDTYRSSAGFLVAVADEMPEPVVVSAGFTYRAYNPISDTYTDTPSTVTAIRVRWQSHFHYPVKSAETFKPGDVVLLVLKAAVTVAAGDRFTLAGVTYNVVSVLDNGTSWAAHLRND